MKISPNIILITVFVSTLGLSGLTPATYASESPYRLVITPQPQRSTELREADSPNDSDSRVKEDGDKKVKVLLHQSVTAPSLSQSALDLTNPPAEVPSHSLMRFGL